MPPLSRKCLPAARLGGGALLAATLACSSRATPSDSTGAAASNVLQAGQPRWERRADMPTPRAGAATFTADGQVFVIGGQNESQFLTTNEVYHPATNKWTSATPMRLGRTFSASNTASINGRLFLIAGNPRGYCTNASDVFDVASGSWRLLRGAPVARCHAATVTAGGRVYVIGGWNTSSTVRYTQVDVFDPLTETWSRSVPLPEARGGAAAAVVDSVIYVIGGWTPADPAAATVEAFDLRTRRWTRKTSMPTARSATTATVLNGRVYVLGGIHLANDVPEFTDIVESYDPATDTWRTESPLPSAIAYGEAVSLGDAIYLIGGRSQRTSASLASVWSLAPRR